VSYGLLADFLDGMLDGCSKETTIVDAWEPSYPYKEQKQFEQAYQTIKQKALDWTAVPDKYRSLVKAGLGIWMDNDWRKKGWNLTDFSKNHFSPAEFENAVRSALRVSDEYVWIYTEQPKWWTRDKLPQAYVDALARARNEIDQAKENAAVKKAREMQEFVGASPDEPLAKDWSLKKAADHLDKAATTWLTHWKCAACHTSYLYVMAGPSLHKTPSPALVKMRQYLEYRVTHWDSGQAADKPGQGSAIKPLPTEGVTEIVATAATLAFLDSQTTGKLQPATRQALDRIWGVQQPNGAWTWNHTNLAPLEYDDYFGAVFAALGVGAAPDGYSQTPEAQKGLARLRTYFQKNPAPNLHHKVWLLWASTKIDFLMTSADRQQTIEELSKLQRSDGGWSLPSLWKPSSMRAKDNQPASDGYATGLVIYVLKQAGLAPNDPRMTRGLAWLKTHQRESGRWFTPSLNGARRNVITNAGTALCAMALRACESDGK
jgi:squalene-hopene/tetraprenyl-beta-curcumene cyclase